MVTVRVGPNSMDTFERAVLNWLRKQREALTITEIHSQFGSMSFPILQGVLNSLLAEGKIERTSPRAHGEMADPTGSRRSDVMRLGTEWGGLGVDDLRDIGGEFQLLKQLNEFRYNAIGVLLRGQSPEDLSAFQTAVNSLRSEGHELTSLLVELRCPSGDGIPRKWAFSVRPRVMAPQKF
jgi:hypothetical protein